MTPWQQIVAPSHCCPLGGVEEGQRQNGAYGVTSCEVALAPNCITEVCACVRVCVCVSACLRVCVFFVVKTLKSNTCSANKMS